MACSMSELPRNDAIRGIELPPAMISGDTFASQSCRIGRRWTMRHSRDFVSRDGSIIDNRMTLLRLGAEANVSG